LASPSIGQVFEPESHNVREKKPSDYSWKDEIPARVSMFNSRIVAKPSGSYSISTYIWVTFVAHVGGFLQ
jgi:hypothetical protein